jgi:hypothetical protein
MAIVYYCLTPLAMMMVLYLMAITWVRYQMAVALI